MKQHKKLRETKYINEISNTDSCCDYMSDYLKYFSNLLKYDDVFREYVIVIDDMNVLKLDYCPWCSSSFPPSLREKFFRVLYSEYKIETDILDYPMEEDIPEEFKTDEWWKKRGL